MAGNFIVPGKIFHGLGTFSELMNVKGKKALIVTGQGSMQRSGYINKATEYLQKSGIQVEVFDGVEADPAIETVMKGFAVMMHLQPDWIIGLGGCSAIDAAKAMWVFYEYPDTNFEDIIPPFTIKPLRNKARFIAIPSTSGTGTEATCVSVITDRLKGTKYPLVSYELCPDIAIVDGELCRSMPSHVTANTGLDALTHALEAYVTPLADAFTDSLAERAVIDIFQALPAAVEDGENLKARQTMHDASCLAGMSFSNALLGIVHSLSHQIGGMFGVPHGRANAILLPNVIRFNAMTCEAKYTKLALLIGEKNSEDIATRIEKLRVNISVESSFKDYGINEQKWHEKLNAMAEHAMADACTGCNPRAPSIEDMLKVLQACFNGEKYRD
ncbi:iron-containing alcohol dehydrogenase [Salmonella enterica]|nr:iron-containing alcohol dehydrogenase [Salmonella enterica]ECS6156063.1 iron-containing alcohol dehydrogenase [Salmonella enterica subsp. enterica serovar Javiana]EBR7649414.1 iron-containing alcohol dehydrogenase [Salmonella enterica]EDQ6154727.1 iron-containing alcohol dehydrogenase [Salmonella enterica subsp. enterica serovar Javiana]EEC5487491.1 iron-containing alcohol dehydrogenase [Salmonella enterica]